MSEPNTPKRATEEPEEPQPGRSTYTNITIEDDVIGFCISTIGDSQTIDQVKVGRRSAGAVGQMTDDTAQKLAEAICAIKTHTTTIVTELESKRRKHYDANYGQGQTIGVAEGERRNN